MNHSDKTVTLLKGWWPNWYGNLGKQFIYVRIRYGQCSIGVGRSHSDAETKASVVREDESLEGVTDIDDAIEELRKQGYLVKSIVVPEHVKELVNAPLG